MHKALRVTARLVVFVSALLFILATPLLAEDIAHRRIIGFSPDGNYFAFEQSGIKNRSGEAYAHIFIIDTRENTWVKGSPFRTKATGRKALQRARRKVRARARSALRRMNIRRKGVRLAYNPITEVNSNPHRVAVMTRRTIKALDEPLVFSIKEINVPTKRCRRLTRKPIKGMVISVRRQGGREQELHSDQHIPKSRGCPTSYRLEDVIRLKKRGGGAVFAFTYSFTRSAKNGEERRYIAGGWHDNRGDYDEPEHYIDLYDYSGRPDYLDEDKGQPLDQYNDRDYTYERRGERRNGEVDLDNDRRLRDDRDDEGYQDRR